MGGRRGVSPEILSPIMWSPENCGGLPPCGDKLFILMHNEPLAVITPRGKYILGRSLLKNALGNDNPDRKELKNGNVHTETLLTGVSGSRLYRPIDNNLKDKVRKKILEISNHFNIDDKIRERALRKLKRQNY
jgi:hypothetical protein